MASVVFKFCSPPKEEQERMCNKDKIIEIKMKPKVKPQKNLNHLL